ncbi:ATP-binding cassette domain-containing protein [Terriglobus aquaticus]|uniref:ATP-binding cassette domain-containing protein n=1 Tax=Terriglobus aquaticus TaxID=940139 RepID=A0ABW9KK32_9BACT|nr:ATP-binding cassette domain-containing protein [Terriglobus aquaticus]
MTDNGGVTFTRVSFTPPFAVSGTENRRILDDVSLQLEPGTTTALLGRSGSGKTTLLRTVNGLVLPTEGEVRVLGHTVHARSKADDLRDLRRSIGYVIQETGLYPHMSVGRNVALPLELLGKPDVERNQRAAELLDTVGLPSTQYADRLPHELSGGQRQRVGLARALATSPKLLLLDEPFGALDPLTRAEMQAMLRDLLARFGTTALIVTHDLQEAIFLAHRILFVADGRVYADLSSGEVLESTEPGVVDYVRAVQRFTPEAEQGS